MSQKRGCCNNNCKAYKDHEKFKHDVNFCPNCGQKLESVCGSHSCNMVMGEDPHKYCRKCQAKRDDRRDKAKNYIAGASAGIAGGAALVAKHGGPALEQAKKIAAILANRR
ncbi:hypothetical protein DD236_09200 [Ancrocorticia populi]|uniref:Uncharacterized protein n=1 Tax=Ancrocorticia populi TaxID=2175228 RepID=A0A2V1K6J1_9ACTO|nr:hypothetical protein DD236_09200 [Ancrocorticia populi]